MRNNKRFHAWKAGERGFTLIEMLSVIAILGVLAALVSASISGVGGSGKTAQIEADKQTIETGTDRFFSEAFPEAYPVVSWDDSPSGLTTGLTDTGVRLIDFDAALPGDASKTFVPDYLKEIPDSAGRVSWRIDTNTGRVFFANEAATLVSPSTSRLNVSATNPTTSLTSDHVIDLTLRKGEATPQTITIDIPAGYSIGGLALTAGTDVGSLTGSFGTDNPWNPGVATPFTGGTLRASGTSNQWNLALDYPPNTRTDRTHTVEITPPSEDRPGSVTITLATLTGEGEANPSTETWKLTVKGTAGSTNVVTNPSTAGVYRWNAEEHTAIDVDGVFNRIAGNQAAVIK